MMRSIDRSGNKMPTLIRVLLSWILASPLLLLSVHVAEAKIYTFTGEFNAIFNSQDPVNSFAGTWTARVDTELPYQITDYTGVGGPILKEFIVRPVTFTMDPNPFPPDPVFGLPTTVFNASNIGISLYLSNDIPQGAVELGKSPNLTRAEVLNLSDLAYPGLSDFSFRYGNPNNSDRSLSAASYRMLHEVTPGNAQYEYFYHTNLLGEYTYTESQTLVLEASEPAELLGGVANGGIDVEFEGYFEGEIVVNPFVDSSFPPTFSLPGAGPLQLWDIHVEGDFGGSAVLSFSYDEATLTVPESDLIVFHYLENSGEWEPLPTTVDEDNNILTATTTSFSIFTYGVESNALPVLMVDVSSVMVDEGQTAINTGTFYDPDGEAVTLTASIGEITDDLDATWSWSLATTDGPTESQTVTVTADDGNGGIATVNFDLIVNNVAPSIESIVLPPAPLAVSAQPVMVSANFSDTGNDAPYSCTIDYGDGAAASSGSILGSTCSGEYTYASPGVYKVTFNITDKDEAASSMTATEYVVIYDAGVGFVTGGGWIYSNSGYCRLTYACEGAEGKANFGFVSKYLNGAKTPSGETEFQFKAGGLDFKSESYEYLVIVLAGAKATFKGVGTINGEGAYGFVITALDANLKPNVDRDLFRIKIWDTEDGNRVVYDNMLGSSDDADPTTTIGGGSIIIHKGK